MTVAIHQPSYLPWPPFLEKALRSDVFVLLDDVQFEKNSEQNRNRIKTGQGEIWLTVPVSRQAATRIPDVSIPAEQDTWRRKHRKSIEFSYGKAPFFKMLASPLFNILDRPWTHLLGLNLAVDALLFEMAGFTGRVVRSSEIGVSGEGSARILNLCRALGARRYLSGRAGTVYLDLDAFESSGVEVLFQQYEHREYRQQYPDVGFLPCLSVIDMMMNVGVGKPLADEMLARGSWRHSGGIAT